MWLTHFGVLGDGQGGLVVTQVKERDERAVLQAEEEVRVRAVFAGAGHHVALDDVVQRQTQDVLVKLPRLLGILARGRRSGAVAAPGRGGGRAATPAPGWLTGCVWVGMNGGHGGLLEFY